MAQISGYASDSITDDTKERHRNLEASIIPKSSIKTEPIEIQDFDEKPPPSNFSRIDDSDQIRSTSAENEDKASANKTSVERRQRRLIKTEHLKTQHSDIKTRPLKFSRIEKRDKIQIQSMDAETREASTRKSDTESRPKRSIKTYHIKKQHTARKSPSKLKTCTISIVILFISILLYKIMYLECTGGIDLGHLRESYSKNLFGQSAAANKIIETLNMQDQRKILFLYGGTGVGKTYAISLMLENLGDAINVYHSTTPSFADNFSPELMFGLTVCKTLILVVDDLTRKDIKDVSLPIQKVVDKSVKLGKNITVILVFNCDNIMDNFVKESEGSCHEELEEQFRTIEAQKQLIKFGQLSEEHLEKCIEKELGNRKLNRQEMNKLLKNFDVAFDGCKGVSTKIKLFNAI